MATRQGIAGVNMPVYINETATRQAVDGTALYFNETVSAAPPSTQVQMPNYRFAYWYEPEWG